MLSRLSFKFLPIFVYFLIALILLIPIAEVDLVPLNIDFIAHLHNILQAKLAILDGQFPLRIAPTDHHGWPYPLFQFYSPTTYMVAGFINAYYIIDPWLTYKVVVVASMVLGASYAAALTTWWFQSSRIGFLSAILYLTLPYKILTLNYLAAFNEFVGMNILPILFYYTLKLFKRISLAGFLIVSSLWYVLLTTHLITFLATSFTIFSLLTLLVIFTTAKPRNCLAPFFSYALGLALAGWHLLPILSLHDLFNANYSFNDVSRLSSHAPHLFTLLSPLPLSFPLQVVQGNIDAMALYQPSISLLVLISLAISMWFYSRKKIDKAFKVFLFLFAIIFIFIWAPFNIWHYLPSWTLVVQYSYRLMSQLGMVSIFIFGYAVAPILSTKRFRLISVYVIIALIMPNFFWLSLQHIGKQSFKKVLPNFSNSDFYLLNIAENHFVQGIDHILLANYRNQQLDFQHFPKINLKEIFLVATKPTVVLKGRFIGAPTQASVYLDKMLINTKQLAEGEFNWEVPLNKNQLNSDSLLKFKFADSTRIKDVTLKEVIGTGFLNQARVISAQTMMHYCSQQSSNLLCNVYVPNGIDLIELPFYYYPKLSTIRLNGRIIDYYSIYYYNNAVLTIGKPLAQQINHITLQFHGSLLGNYISATAWQMWLLLLAYYFLKHLPRYSLPIRHAQPKDASSYLR